MHIREEYFERASRLVNGFFYTFEYYPRHPKELYDKNPFIFCIGPVEGRDNLFTAINLHHVTVKERELLIKYTQTQYGILDDDIQHLVSEESLNRLVPGILFGLRVYNMKNVYNLIRVKNPAVPLFIYGQGNIFLGTPDDKYIKYMINSGIYKDSKNLQ